MKRNKWSVVEESETKAKQYQTKWDAIKDNGTKGTGKQVERKEHKPIIVEQKKQGGNTMK